MKEERAGGDDAIRPAFPATPDGLASSGRDTYLHHQQLISVRRRHAWLTTARTTVRHLENSRMVYLTGGADGRLLAALNLAAEAARLPAPGALAVLSGSAQA